MKLTAAKVNAFLKNPDKNINFVLVYGPDAGLVSEHSKSICKIVVDDLNDPFRVTSLSFDKIKSDPSIFSDELNAISMMGGRRLIRVETSSASLPKEFIQILENSNSDAMVVFSAGELTPASSLRKFFEKATNSVAIPCYKDESNVIEKLIATKFNENSISCESGVVQFLSSKFAGDRMVVLSEVEKLIIFIGDQKTISLSDVQAVIFDSSEFSLDELCSAFASRNPQNIDKHMTRALSENVVPVVIIRSLLRYFMRLQDVQNKINAGLSQQQALSSLRPPIFFKQLPIFKRHLSMWKAADISRVIKKLIDLEIACKTTGNPAELLCSRMLLILPLAVR